jgi:RNA recognition motif-containing protein
MKLQITNIARNVSEEDFKKLFEKFGPLVECTLVLDKDTGKSKGFGFVTVGNTACGAKAIEMLNGRSVNGQKLKVKRAPA